MRDYNNSLVMSVSLRPPQSEAIEQVQAMFRAGHRRVVLCAPTGSGKTVMFSEIAWKTFMKGKRVMILTHRKELLKQAGKFNNNGCEICMVETLYNKMKRGTFNIADVDLLIIDEAHIGNFKKVLTDYNGYVIGATATPLTKPTMSLLYNEIVCNMDIPSQIAMGYLSVPRTFLKTSVGADISKLEVKAGEYTERSLDGLFNKPKVYSGMVDDYVKSYFGQKAIYFCVNVDHTIHVHAEFEARGLPSIYMVHSKQPEYERDRQIELFTASTDGVLVNCGIATTGFDVPDIRVVGVGRATKSLNLWLQMCGRGSRVIPNAKGTFTILDYGENVIRLGHWEAERDWRKIFFTPDKKRKGEQPAPVKECPNCKAIVYASAKICPHCQHEFDIKSVIIPEGELVEMVYKKTTGRYLYDLTYEELFDIARIKKWKQAFVERILFFNPVMNSGPSNAGAMLHRFWDTKEYKQSYRDRRLQIFAGEKPVANFIIKR